MTAHRDEDEWLRVQYQMAHHDIWWVKAQQMNAGYWTLLLLAAVVGVGKLIHEDRSCTTAPWEGWLLRGLATLVTVLGVLYVWNLHSALVQARNRAAVIVQPLQHSVFDEVKLLGRHSLPFPIAVTLVLLGALGLVWWHFGALCQLRLPGSAVSSATAPTRSHRPTARLPHSSLGGPSLRC